MQPNATQAKLSVAPMMDWTDRHCRHFHRQLSRHAVLYTEMVTADAVIHGDRDRLLGFDPIEHPVVLQLGGSDPAKLAEAARIGADRGYDVINLNCGCPSDRVQSGTFGACLMRDPAHVARLVEAMKVAVTAPVTVKCRIGVDDQDPATVLPSFIRHVVQAGADGVIVHARKAWLQGLSPKENRDVPPLDYELVLAMKRANPDLWMGINGGITSLQQAQQLLEAGMDEVMIGRTAYQAPGDVLLNTDSVIFNNPTAARSRDDAVHAMLPYIERHLAAGGRLNQITRHMLGLFHGQPGARMWRRILSENAHLDGAGTGVVLKALAAVTPDQAQATAA